MIHRAAFWVVLGIALLGAVRVGFAAGEGAAVTPPVATAAPEEAAELRPSLRPRFVAGQRSRFEVWSRRETRNNITAGGRAQQVNTSMELTGEILWVVERVGNDGGATCVMTIDWLEATLGLADGAGIDVDSRRPVVGDPGTPELFIAQLLHSITAVPLAVKMSPDGTVLGITGMDAVRRKAGAGAKPPDEVDFVELASDLATIVGAPLSTPIGAGGKWDVNFVWNHELGKLQQPVSYTLKGTEEIAGIAVATVIGNGRLKLVPDASALPPADPSNPAGPKSNLRFINGTFDTQIMLDLSRGEVVGRNSVRRIGIELRSKINNLQTVRTIDETLQSQTLRIWEE